VLFCGLPAFGLPPAAEHSKAMQERLLEPVRSIESANRISGWEHLDDQHVVLRLSAQDQYLITLRNRCLGLSWALNVGVTMSNNTIWAGFDAITVDGNQCEIELINPMGSP
jgi:hypothetical protein